MLIIIDMDDETDGLGIGIQELMYNLFTLIARKCYIFHAVGGALRMVLQLSVAGWVLLFHIEQNIRSIIA
jgi:hypothetical protein